MRAEHGLTRSKNLPPLLRECWNKLNRAFMRRVKTIGLTPDQYIALRWIHAFPKGEISQKEYETFMQDSIVECIKIQEDLDLDVLVHGEPERNDMVQYFGELLSGFAFTSFGWVQSYGTRCVKPPIIFGDVERPEAMTVKWSEFAQKNTK